MLPMAFHFSDQINPDGVAYLRIAGYYLKGDVAKAISGYWSPLYSWLLIPWLALGVPGLLATKLLGVPLVLAWVVGIALLGRRYLENATARALLVAAAAVSVLTWSIEVISPDLLLAVVLTYYFYLVSDPAAFTRPARSFACGLLGGFAYLAKSFAFPFFIVHFLGTGVLYVWAQPGLHRRKRYVSAVLAGLLGFLAVAAPWVAVLSVKYGRLTVSTAVAGRNVPMSVSYGVQSLERAPFPPELKLSPIEPGRLTAWETPDLVYARSIRSTGAAQATPASARLRVILANVSVIRDRLSEFDYFHLAVAALIGSTFVGLLRGRSSAAAARYLWGTFTVVLYGLGYLPLWAREERYYWPVAGLLMVLTFGMVEQFVRVLTHYAEQADSRRVRVGRWVVLAELVVALSYLRVGGHSLLLRYWSPRADFGQLAAQLDEAARRRGASLQGPIAGNNWPGTVYLAYTMNQPSYGSTTTEDPVLLAAELSRLGIWTYFVFNNEALAERLKQSNQFRPLAELAMIRRTPPAILAAFEVHGGSASR